MRALVFGGTGPTGHFIVNGLIERGYDVTILHSGRHEVDEIPDSVEHIHTDAYSGDAVRDALAGREFELCVAAYGRLRVNAELMQGRCDRFLSIGGVPAYRGYVNPGLLDPPGLPVPTAEDATRIFETDLEDQKSWRIVRTEDALFQHQPEATHFRYPVVYGPYQPMPREWCIIRRVLDGRKKIILPDGGLTLQVCAFAQNCAHALLLAVDQPEVSKGQIYNCSDEETLTLRQTVEVIAKALGSEIEVVSMPFSLAKSARPLISQTLTTHRVLDIGKLKHELGYRDRVPAREAFARTAHWWKANPCDPGGMEETVLQDPFDYAAEDRLIASWERAMAQVEDPGFEVEPGYTMSYTGPGGRASSKDFE